MGEIQKLKERIPEPGKTPCQTGMESDYKPPE